MWQIESIEQKIDRAYHHLTDLDSLIPQGRSNLYSVSRDIEADGRTEVYTFHPKQIPQPIIAAVVGDFIYNAWSALNHMAIALHMTHTGIPTEEEMEGIEFPMALDPTKFERMAQNRIWGVHPEAYTIIERNQPYHPGNAAYRWLYLLAKTDRHRKLNLLYQQISGMTWVGDPDGEWVEFNSYKALEDGTVLGRFRWKSEPDPSMDFNFSCEVALSDGQQIERARLLTDWIYNRIFAIRDELAPFYFS